MRSAKSSFLFLLVALLPATVTEARAQDACPRRIAYTVSHLVGKIYSHADLHVLDPGATEPRRLAAERSIHLETGRGPWSPDGSRLAILSMGEEDVAILEKYRLGWVEEAMLPSHAMLYVIDAGDLSLHRVTDAPAFFFAWSPDGTRIAFQSQYEDPGSSGRMYDLTAPAALYLVDAAGGAPRRITEVLPGVGSPVWSPDGRRVAFETFQHDPPADLMHALASNREIHVVDVETLEDFRVTDDPGFDSQPAWSPDGSLLSYIRVRPGATRGEMSMDVWVRGAAGEPERRIDERSRLVPLGWSADGTRLYRLAASGENEEVLTALEVTAGGTAPPARGVGTRLRIAHGGVDIDADGRRLVWLEPADHETRRVRELDLETGTVRDLATIPHEADAVVAWSGCLAR